MNYRQRALPNLQTMRSKLPEGASISDRVDQADSLARPFRRRFRKMARPARVDMR